MAALCQLARHRQRARKQAQIVRCLCREQISRHRSQLSNIAADDDSTAQAGIHTAGRLNPIVIERHRLAFVYYLIQWYRLCTIATLVFLPLICIHQALYRIEQFASSRYDLS